jgi:hypothetical protein
VVIVGSLTQDSKSEFLRAEKKKCFTLAKCKGVVGMPHHSKTNPNSGLSWPSQK